MVRRWGRDRRPLKATAMTAPRKKLHYDSRHDGLRHTTRPLGTFQVGSPRCSAKPNSFAQ